ncbi:ABC transporter substrate-binding protein [Chloroflexota bacterium]
MKKKLLALLIGMSVISALIAVPLMTACAPEGAPEAPGEPAAPTEPAAPGEPAAPEAPKEPKTVKVGFLSALTGEAAPWGLPGLYGCEIWVDEVNAAGGLQVGDDRYLIEIAAYDDEGTASKSVTGAKKLVLEDEVVIVLQMMSPAAHATAPFLTEHKIIGTVNVSTDVGPDYPYLLNLTESYPLNVLATYDYVARTNPEAKTVAMSNPEGETYRLSAPFTQAAWEAAGVEVVYNQFYDPMTVDFTPIATAMLASGADIMCWDAAYPGGTNLLTEEAYFQGFDGPITSVTLDLYKDLIERVGKEYIEGYTYMYPDFSDPALTPEQNAFYAKYEEIYPGTWGAVSWIWKDNLVLWAKYVEKTGSIDSMTVFNAMKADPNPMHSFGPGEWLGEEVFGIDNALVGMWPVIEIQDGEPVIVEMGNLAEWYRENVDLVVQYYEAEGLMWYQK